ncbi:HCP-like protein [Saccharata proteae CBS 121410]|uniref:HCP-like protein n=1 Tax=Saccharata proteae CBS 121410 TaxID=1314787 RepID=A0A9P4HYE7_9PEZI|nr:HCP-like protein [Saccharata proteae CBS 121410]
MRAGMQRPNSAYTLGSDLHVRGRTSSPNILLPSPSDSPVSWGRSPSSGRSSEHRPASYVDLLNSPYAQQLAITQDFTQAGLKGVVGNNASLLDTKKTLEMYRMNVKKTPDASVQYEFAVFLIQAAKDVLEKGSVADLKPEDLTREARQILQRLSDRSYPFAQYLLADGFASGFFNKGKQDYDRAFPLFLAASKHGHAESGYRAALCYEQGWGTTRNYAKAAQFYRTSASKNHPGAANRLGHACLHKEMGLLNNRREGLTWLKRATESADMQYRDAPYELGLLHENGFGDDVFKDEAYAAQLFTQAAELGHPLACLKMGEAYEHGKLGCPRDPALSVHFYTGAAQAGIPEAMMNLCAWYMCGAPPVLDRDEAEAYEWARTAANCGLPKAEYAVGYFTEMGIGCRRDPLEANVWYVKAAEAGDERAKQRLAIIRAAAAGDTSGVGVVPTKEEVVKDGKGEKGGKKGKWFGWGGGK